MQVMGIVNAAAEAPIQSILTSNYPRAIIEKLAGAGVPQLTESQKSLIKPLPPPASIPVPSIEVRDEPEFDLADELSALHISPPQSRPVSRERSVTPPSPTSLFSFTTNFTRRSSSPFRSAAPVFTPRASSPSRHDEFSRILDRIIKNAEGNPNAAVSTSLAFSQLFTWGDPQRDFHVGVAGEVYVSQHLKS